MKKDILDIVKIFRYYKSVPTKEDKKKKKDKECELLMRSFLNRLK